MTDRLPFVRIRSEDTTPEAAFRKWQAVLPQYSIRLPDGHDIGDFDMDASAWLLEPLVVMAGRTRAAWVDRLPSGEAKGEQTNLVFALFREGRWKGEAEGRPFDFGDGELIGLDTSRASTGLSTDSHWIMINVPRRALAKLVPAIPDLHGHVFRSASAGFLIDHMMSLERHLPTLSTAEAERITRASLTLIAAALDELAARKKTNQASTPPAIRNRVERYIQQNLSSPALTPDMISKDLEIARSTLYRAFAELGGVSAFIQERRLEAARAILFHPEDHRTIGDIANVLGFDNTATFSKAFHRRFGCSPRVARATGTTRIPLSGRQLFDFWTDVLRDAKPPE